MEARHVIRAVVPMVAGAVALAGCGGSSGGNNASSNSSGGGGGGGTTYTIAYQGPLSGGNQQLGLNMKYAVQLAVNQANSGKTFGTLPFKLKYAEADDQGLATVGPTAARKILGISNLIAVVGPAFSGATKASEPFYSQAGVATVSPSATDPSLATSGWKNFFRVVADDNSQGPADATYIAKVAKLKKVYVLDDASAYAAGLSGAFAKAAPKDGLTVVKKETAPGTTQCQAGTGNTQQYPGLATKVKGSGAQAVFYAGYYCDAALLVKALRSAGYTGLFVSDDGTEGSKFIEQAGTSAAEGTVVSCACQEVIKSAEFTTFAQQFKQLAGFDAGTYSAEAYDATNAIISAMKSVGSGSVSKSQVIDALHASGFSWKGISKTVQFTSNGNYAGTAVYMYQVKNGKFAELGLVSKLVGG